MKTPVIWVSFDGTPPRCRWDQNVVENLLCPPEEGYQHFYSILEFAEYRTHPDNPVVVVFAAGGQSEHLPALNRFIKQFESVVLVLTSDEHGSFPWHNIQHKDLKLWVQSGRPDRHRAANIRFFPLGCPELKEVDTFQGSQDRFIDVGFWGQVTHLQRERMEQAFPDKVFATDGFMEGLDHGTYMTNLARTKVALAPSGPQTPESFRLWEALECGAVPIVDQGPLPDELGRAVAGYPRGFWDMLLGYNPPFPVVDDWAQAPGLAEAILTEYPIANNEVFAWYQRYKRDLRIQMYRDAVTGQDTGHVGIITVLVPTSPTPNNPEMDHLMETLVSIRDQLPDSEILLMMDGVRYEQAHRRPDYEEYRRRVLWHCNHHWRGITPFYFNEHLHQAEMTRRTLEHVHTPFVLFVEHDTPLVGDIPWQEWLDALADGNDVIRTYHEVILQPEHMHLMEEQYGDYIRTHQWSQRPHLARTSWYRKMIELNFPTNFKGMIEDHIHGVAQSNPDEFRILLYAPPGNIQRATHVDARGDDPKWVDS